MFQRNTRTYQSGFFTDFYFFDNWCILREAIVTNQKQFVTACMKQLDKQQYGSKYKPRNILVEVSGIYGRIWPSLFKEYRCCDAHPYHTALENAIRHKQYQFIEYFITEANGCGRWDSDSLFNGSHAQVQIWGHDRLAGIFLTGTAIECNDLKALQLNEMVANINN